MSASIVSRVSVNTAVTSAFVADSSYSSIGVADCRFAARRSSSNLEPPHQHGGLLRS